MSVYLRDVAIVLGVRPHRERDAWVSLWTKHHGKQDAYMTGYQSPHSKQRAHIQPFAEVEVVLAEGKHFLRLAVARMTAGHAYDARQHPIWAGMLGSICRLCESIAAPQDPLEDARIFSLFQEVSGCASQFQQMFSPERALFFQAFLLQRFAALFGYAIALTQCARCGANPISCTGFHLQEGGFLCTKCEHDVLPGRSPIFQTEEPVLRKLLLYLEQASLPDALRLSAPKSVLRDLALLYEGMMTVLPLKKSPLASGYLDSFLG